MDQLLDYNARTDTPEGIGFPEGILDAGYYGNPFSVPFGREADFYLMNPAAVSGL